jgi:predicted nucleotidyltransferase component of viral defense system
MNQEYLDTVRLLLAIAPAIFESSRFAIKGGTALNLFVQDLPRLSVDIDLVFTDHTLDRDSALTAIAGELSAAQARVQGLGYVAKLAKQKQGEECKMFVESDSATVKVEVNVVFRGTVLPIEPRSLTRSAQDTFTSNITIPSLQTPELYGSKLVAALDRQHPRDFFDVQIMLKQFGVDVTFVDCFVAYLAGHNRPIHEVLFTSTPRRPPKLPHFWPPKFLHLTGAS